MYFQKTKTSPVEKIIAITVNWNRFEDTCECLDSLIAQEDVQIELIVVDNGSTDNSGSRLQNIYPNLKLIRSTENLGFAGGYNLGIKHALACNSDYIMIINNDTVAEKNMVKKLLLEMDAEEIGATSPLILYYSNPEKIWSSGGDINRTVLMPIDSHHRNEILKGPIYRTFLSGCCLLMKRTLIESVGYFDERFFLYCEDLDFCLRIKRTKWRMKIVPAARLLHKVSLSSGGELSPRERYHIARSTILYYRKYVNMRNFIVIFLFRIISSVLWTFRLILSGNFAGLNAYLCGLIDGLRDVMNPKY